MTAQRYQSGQSSAHYAALGGRSNRLCQAADAIERRVRSPTAPFTVCSASFQVSRVHAAGPLFARSARINQCVGMCSTHGMGICEDSHDHFIILACSMTAAERPARQRVSCGARRAMLAATHSQVVSVLFQVRSLCIQLVASCIQIVSPNLRLISSRICLLRTTRQLGQLVSAAPPLRTGTRPTHASRSATERAVDWPTPTDVSSVGA
jgi:hypothetical protein